MKIVIPFFAPADSFVDNVATTLRDMGHEVTTMPPVSNALLASRPYNGARLLARKLLPGRPSFEERWLLKIAAQIRPEAVLALTQALSDETLFGLQKLGVRARIAWWGDAPANMAGMGLLSDGWDLIFLKDNDTVAKFRRVGLPAELLHEAMNPRWHRPIASRENDEIAIVGSFYGYRQLLTTRLIRAGVSVGLYGSRLPRWVLPEIAARHRGRFVIREEKSRVFGAALGALNSTALNEGNSVNCRAFEIAGAGGLQLLEYRPAIEDCFEPGRELLTFKTFDELLAHIDWAKRDPAGVEAVRRAGAQRALAQHTYQHRLTKILAAIS
jgi:spore maturation protein CgeB